MADVFTGLDVRVFISTTAVTSATDTTGEFAALTWTEIELVESLDPYGDSAGIVNFNGLKDARVRKGKGARNAGDPTLTVGYDYSDAGQQALRTAQGTSSKYGFKVQLPNKLATAGADQIDYFRAMVMSAPTNVGNTETVVRQTFQLAIDSPIYTTAPTTGA